MFLDEEDESRIREYPSHLAASSPRSFDVYGASAACDVPTHDVSPLFFYFSLSLLEEESQIAAVVKSDQSLLTHLPSDSLIDSSLSLSCERPHFTYRIRQSASSLNCYFLSIKLIFLCQHFPSYGTKCFLLYAFSDFVFTSQHITVADYTFCFAAINVAKAVVPG